MKQYFGKYRGKVENNLDPYFQGRLEISCPAVLGDGKLSWAMPCTPYAGSGVGLLLTPPNRANVWVEFEKGNPNYPIWSGCFWDKGTAPTKLPKTMMLKTDSLTVTLSDLPGGGGVTIEAAPPAVAMPLSIKLSSTGIEIKNGKNSVNLTPASVSVNDGALEVI